MLARRFTSCVVVSVLGLGAAMLAGCLERVESITIAPDGSAMLRSEFRGTPEDFKKTDDALPEAGGAWAVTQREERDAEGKPRVVRVAELSVARGDGLPGTYGAPDDPRAASGLAFPTTLRVNTTGGHTYFDFSRTYVHREEAKYAYAKKRLMGGDAFKAMEGKDPADMTGEQRELLMRTLARLEADKHVRFIDAGAAALEAERAWPQEVALSLRTAALEFADRFDIAEASTLLGRPRTPERDAALEGVKREFMEGLHAAIKASLDRFALPQDQVKRFIDAALAERARRQATEDLADERWVVRVTMPGTIIAHNADRVEGNTLVWEFTAEAIMDRDQTVRATSSIAPAK